MRHNLKVKEVWYDAGRYIVCHNPEQALHDQKARQCIVAKLEKKVKNSDIKSLIGNPGYRRYLLIKDAVVGVDQKALKEASRYGGKVERVFRDLKSTLDLRPIYHWKDRRVRGHVMVCFLALVLESALHRSLKQTGSPVEYTYLIRDLKQLKAVRLDLENKQYICRTELPGCSYEAFKAIGLRPPNQIIQSPTN